MLSVVFGLIYFQQKLDQTSVQNINGVLFLCVMNTTFSNLFAVVNVNLIRIIYIKKKNLTNSTFYIEFSS